MHFQFCNGVAFYIRYIDKGMIAKCILLIVLLLAAPSQAQETFMNRLFVGYQGWFSVGSDGTGTGWSHYKFHPDQPFGKDNALIDFWPECSEYEKKYPIPEFGPGIYAFSAADFSTVRTHFQWMQQYGIDGAFLQRFAVDLKDPAFVNLRNRVTENVINAAAQAGRLWGLMYDLTGLQAGEIRSIVMNDYNRLKAAYNFREQGQYIKHKGKPLISVWGVGFADGRKYSLAECDELINFFKADGNTVLIGVPRYWREGGKDAVTGPSLNTLHQIIKKCDVVHPWQIGKYTTIAEAQNDARVNTKADIQWCQSFGLTLMPVIWPGFSFHNSYWSTDRKVDPMNRIPRKQGGQYLLQVQGTEVVKVGARAIFVAMFDEMNEGTNIFKCVHVTPSTPDGLKFVSYEEAPEFYLQMTGNIARTLKLAAQEDEKELKAKEMGSEEAQVERQQLTAQELTE